MTLRELARRPHPCAPWLDLTESVKSELFPGGTGEDPASLRLRLEELHGREHQVPELPQGIVDSWAPGTRAAWERIRAGAPVVMTGQQPVLGGGPWFVWLKAAGAIASARRASKLLGVDVVPLFWIAGDDSDLPEVASIGDPLSGESLQADFASAPEGTPVGALPWADGEASRLGEGMSRLWSGTAAGSIQRGAAGLSEALRRSLEHWFPDAGLAVVDAAWPGMRASFARSYAVFARHHETVSQALAQGIEAARDQDLPVTLKALEGRTRLFSLEGGVRTRLDAPEDPEALAQAILGNPEGYSHDAASRIFAAECAFPVLAHVLGPGEFAYVACLGRVQERLGKRIGLALPRPSLTLLPAEVAARAPGAGHGFDRKCPASPRSLELEFLRRRHPETAALGRFWQDMRHRYLEALGSGDAALNHRLAAREERLLRRRLLDKASESPEEIRGIRELWAWLGAGALQERCWTTWAIEAQLGRGALDAVGALLDEFDNSCHLVAEAS